MLDRLERTLASLSHYDLVLAAIPAVFALAALVGVALSVPARQATTAAAVVGAIVLVDALFVRPPRFTGGP